MRDVFTPPMSPAAREMFAFLLTLARELRATPKDPLGSGTCRDKIVGRVRRRLGPIDRDNVVSIAGESPGKRELAEFLAGHCRGCGLCELGQGRKTNPVMRQPRSPKGGLPA